jgi:SAM-dependent methyltransferase
MRITYRRGNIKDYWTQRWDTISADIPMENTSAYPLKYAEEAIAANDGKILEAGCGAGRLLRYYKERGYDITGFDFIDSVVNKLKSIDPELNVETGDILNLSYADKSFKYILSFGLYHNIEHGLDQAIKETYRVLEPGGIVCASFRADNLQTRLTDWYASYNARKKTGNHSTKGFHKMNLKKHEFIDLFKRGGFDIHEVYDVENMPVLYKFSFFRSRQHKVFDENLARKDGYQLSFSGGLLQRFLMRYFSSNFCNLYVLIAQRPN